MNKDTTNVTRVETKKIAADAVVGIDVGDRTSKVVVLDAAGRTAEKLEVATTPAGMGALFARCRGVRVAFETGTHCRWMYALAEDAGVRAVVADARRLRLVYESDTKNDWNDAAAIAELARNGSKLLHPVHLRSEKAQHLLRLVEVRDTLVRARTALVNQARGFCKSAGGRLASCSSESFEKRLKEMPPEVESVMFPAFEALQAVDKAVSRYDGLIEQELETNFGEDAKLLRKIPGVGPVTAATFIATVGDASTFDRARAAGPYFGLAPRQDQSGDTDKQLPISKAGHTLMRRLLVTSANYIMGRGPDTDLRRLGERLEGRGGKNMRKRAKVAVARKLAVVMLAILKKRTDYVPLRGEQAKAAPEQAREATAK